jgi:superfamily I DNA and/or RNA helicase
MLACCDRPPPVLAAEPALLCALAAAHAQQLVIVGDTRQLPPTVVSASPELRDALGKSPMARLEQAGIGRRTLQLQYRMPPELLAHPSAYFYGSLVRCARTSWRPPPMGFDWPSGLPLCFVDCGDDSEVSDEAGGTSHCPPPLLTTPCSAPHHPVPPPRGR